jgi:hypothetical protein
MDPDVGDEEAKFSAYMAGLLSVIGHADRAKPLRDYCEGLLMPSERKSVEPLAALTAPERTAAQHQSLLHFVGEGGWSDERVLSKVQEMVLPKIEQHGPIEAWIIDDTGFPKKGRHSVGVARQYCGQLGKQDNCQVAVSLSLANAEASLPVAYRLYLPEAWASDAARRKKAGVPEAIGFQTKIEIALDQLRAAHASGLPRGCVLLDAGYGPHADLRAAITALGLSYAAGILSSTTVWAPGRGPLPPKPATGRGRPATRLRRDAEHQPVKVKALALSLQPGHGGRSPGARARMERCARASRACAFASPGATSHAASRGRRNGCSSNGPKARRSRPSIGCPRYRATSASPAWSISPSCVGASSVTTRNSSRRSGSVTLKEDDGAASITTPRCASPPMASSSPSARRFPPQRGLPPTAQRRLAFPKISDRAALPLRTERHVPNSIATMRRALAAAIALNLARCPCCARINKPPTRSNL